MELMAAIAGLEALKRPCRVRLYTDSIYLRDGITRWLPAWKARGWRTADKKPVKNVDLWQRLEAAAAPHEIEWHWVRGHAGHPENERADALARAAIVAMPESGSLMASMPEDDVSAYFAADRLFGSARADAAGVVRHRRRAHDGDPVRECRRAARERAFGSTSARWWTSSCIAAAAATVSSTTPCCCMC